MRIILYCIGFIFLSSCGGFSTEQDLYKWISDEKNGLIKTKDMGGVIIKVKYLPAEYLVYNEVKGKHYSQAQVDSLTAEFKKTRSFLMTLEFKKTNSGDNVLASGTDHYNEYKERIEKLNFALDEYVTIKTEDAELAPVLWTLENTYTVGNKRNLYITFGDEKIEEVFKESSKLDLVFNDEIFYTGIAHFVFDNKQLQSVPKIKFWQFENTL